MSKRGRKNQSCTDYDALRHAHAVDPRPAVVARAIGANIKQVRRWLREIGIDPPPIKKHRAVNWVGTARLVSTGKRIPCKLYDAWLNMRRRVFSNHPRVVPYYRDKGIKMAAEWNDYEVFRAWGLATGFRRGMSLDRTNTDGNYEPANCRWIPRSHQQDNQHRTHKLTLNGVTKSLPEWGRELGLASSLLRTRIKSGWTHEQILTTPKLIGGQMRAGVPHKPRGRKPKSADARDSR